MKKYFCIVIFFFFSNTLPINTSPSSFLKSKNTVEYIDHKYYFELYSSSFKQSECSFYKLTQEMVKCNSERENVFKIDTLIKGFKVKSSSYSKTGYDKGHLTPASHFCFNQEAINSTFLMSNISPQLPNFNRGIWKELENLTKLWAEKKGDCWIFSGPIFEGNYKKISNDSIPVPTHFYKIIYCKLNNKIETISFILKHQEYNKDLDLKNFISTIDEVELKTNIDFFNNLTKEKQKDLESKKLNGTWQFY